MDYIQIKDDLHPKNGVYLQNYKLIKSAKSVNVNITTKSLTRTFTE